MDRNPIERFTSALRTSEAANLVCETTIRNYQAGRVPHALRLLLAFPRLADAFAADVRRMSRTDRAALRQAMAKGGKKR